MEPASSSPASLFSDAPFSGLVICVTGFSKEALLYDAKNYEFKKLEHTSWKPQRDWEENTAPVCILDSVGGSKIEHAFKYRSRTGLFVVTFQWFIDSVMRNMRLRESLYVVKTANKTSNKVADSCNTALIKCALKPAEMTEERHHSSDVICKESEDSFLFGHKMYIDSDVSAELQSKVVEAANQMGAIITDKWLVGCGASYVVCEGPSILRYLGHVENIVTPIWILKTARERRKQRFTRFSADLAREVRMLLENIPDGFAGKEKLTKRCLQDVSASNASKEDAEERQRIVNFAKNSIRNRRNHGMQVELQKVGISQGVLLAFLESGVSSATTSLSFGTRAWSVAIQPSSNPAISRMYWVSLRAITPRTLLDSICWSISEPPSTASVYSDASVSEDCDAEASGFPNAKDDDKTLNATFLNSSRPLNESEKNELILRHHFITLLFPVDRFSEMGPSSRTFYSDKGFTCLQVLNLIYAFYQEDMSDHEIEAAIHTDSRHADQLRAAYSGEVAYKRIDFLGSRRSFEMLKRVSGDNTGNVYEVVIRA